MDGDRFCVACALGCGHSSGMGQAPVWRVSTFGGRLFLAHAGKLRNLHQLARIGSTLPGAGASQNSMTDARQWWCGGHGGSRLGMVGHREAAPRCLS